MAKFWMEDGTTMGGDKIFDKLSKNKTDVNVTSYSPGMCVKNIHPLVVPHGRRNINRFVNINPCDLLTHLQQTMNANKGCILSALTSKPKSCVKTSRYLMQRLNAFNDIINSVKEEYHQYDNESEYEYMDRILDIIMRTKRSDDINMIRCNQCIQQWLISEEW